MAELPSSPDPTSAAPGTPALVGLPVERHPLALGDWPSADEYPPPDTARTIPRQMAPIPLIGAVPFGCTITDSRRYVLTPGQTIDLGQPEGAPSIVGVFLNSFGATAAVELMPYQLEQPSPALQVTLSTNVAGLQFFPVRAVRVRNPANLSTNIEIGVMFVAYRDMR